MENTGVKKNLRLQHEIITLLCTWLIFHVFTVTIADEKSAPYIPNTEVAIGCGSSGINEGSDQRSWVGDIDSKLFSLVDKNRATIASAVVDPLQKDVSVPYRTARFSRSEFTYTVPVAPGPKFIIRLHFYSDTYFDRSKALFSVKADDDRYTLLHNFSVFRDTAHAQGSKYIVKEFHVHVQKQVLSITFAPENSVPEAFAFVNGIEVLSAPTDLYFLDPERDGSGPTIVGRQGRYPLGNDTVLEQVYRINVGGRDVSPDHDTGLYRRWEGTDEENYEMALGLNDSISVSTSANLSYTKIPGYIAPAEVYETARSITLKNGLIKGYNLTGEFPVDSGFSYMVRLHFCEIAESINSSGDRVFAIFIGGRIAEDRADVIKWTGGKYVTYYRDYIVLMDGNVDENTEGVNLPIALQAVQDRSLSVYRDAILNGVEIFKLKDGDGKPRLALQSQQQRKGKNNRTAVVGIVSGVISVGVVFSVLGSLILRRWKKVKDYSNRSSSYPPTEQCRYFSLAEIKAATSNFNDEFVIGVGGFGNVYKGHINSRATSVAIKRLKPESSQGAHEFKTEIETLSRLRHLNLVSLIGYCNDRSEMILVYEYMPHGTLSDHLYNTENPPLTWEHRLRICIGAANGLHYLHSGVKPMIIHRDVKTTNILLDEKWTAKVSDFGLSKVGPSNCSKTHVSTMVKGSIGYLDPEYYRLLHLTEKSDVYSFGVVLCEVLCGRPPVMRTAEPRQISLAEWTRSCYRDGLLDQIVDPHLAGQIEPECLKKYGEIAVSCMSEKGAQRPSMKEVLWGLESAMRMQNGNSAEDQDTRRDGQVDADGELIRVRHCSWGDTSGAVFSEITDVQAR